LLSRASKCQLKPPPTGSPLLLHARAVETLSFLDRRCRVMKESVALASSGADTMLRFWNARAGQLILSIPNACEPNESVRWLSAEDTNTFVVTGDSGGRVRVWDISALAEQLSAPEPLQAAHGIVCYAMLCYAMRCDAMRCDAMRCDAMRCYAMPLQPSLVKMLFTWRAHMRAIVRVEYLRGIEGVLTASTDCTVRLWTLAGEQVGVFGQTEAWALEERHTWLDGTRCTLGEDNDNKVARVDETQLRLLMPPSAAGPARKQVQA
jgi:WD40 repeat protein